MMKLLVGMAASFWCLIGFWLFWPYDPIRIDRFLIDKTVIEHGEKMCFRFEGEKLLSLQAKVLLELTNGETIELMRYEANNVPGTILKSRCFIMPYHIVPRNDYKLKWTGVYEPNPIRKIIETASSEFFEVKTSKVSQGEQGMRGKTGAPGAPGKNF